ncbi:Cilia- and flagella-associated protein [Oopsacas minuta]|uniref:Cilia- and flagella-associated protein n=1 Tax=Oopsacas minuta TaxID=111878 RepID=A0AAV7K211_9METZ|nr:Cilia- and flagella-associated protein [Oopsacas minuta]
MDTESKSLFNQEFSMAVARNSVISVEPNEVLFRNYKLGQPITHLLHIINTSGREQRFHILPLETGPFSLKYEKKQNLLPGMNQTIQVKFTPKDYLQCLQTLHINCPNEENLSIPITAFPSPELSGFPNTLHFANTPIHTSTSLQFTLTSDIFIPFKFEMIFNPPSEVFSVQPSSGELTAKGSIEITVTFNPQKLRTSISNLELTLPEINPKIKACSCTGSCLPNTINLTDKVISERKLPYMGLQKKVTKHKFISHSRRQKALISKRISESKGTSPPSLRDKERDFLLAVLQGREDEKMNQLKCSTNIGYLALTQPELSQLTNQRELNTSPKFSTSNQTQIGNVKLERNNEKLRSDHHKMIPYSGQDQRLNWREKRELLCRFSLAAKRVVIQRRAERRLKCIRIFLQQVKDLDLSRDQYDTVFAKPTPKKSPITLCTPNLPIPFLLIREECSKNSAPKVPFIPFELVRPVWEVEEEEPIFQTVPPDYAQQQNYKKLPLASEDNYLPYNFGKKKRKGAEHEYVGIFTEKRDETIPKTEEIIRNPSQPISEHILNEQDTVSVLEEVESYQSPKIVPNSPDELQTEIYLLEAAPYMKGNVEAFPTDGPRKLDMRENSPILDIVSENNSLPPEPEKYVHIDREDEINKIDPKQLEKGKRLNELRH